MNTTASHCSTIKESVFSRKRTVFGCDAARKRFFYQINALEPAAAASFLHFSPSKQNKKKHLEFLSKPQRNINLNKNWFPSRLIRQIDFCDIGVHAKSIAIRTFNWIAQLRTLLCKTQWHNHWLPQKLCSQAKLLMILSLNGRQKEIFWLFSMPPQKFFLFSSTSLLRRLFEATRITKFV